MSKSEFEEMINRELASFSILGVEFLRGTALRILDPAAFDQSYRWYLSDNDLVGEQQ